MKWRNAAILLAVFVLGMVAAASSRGVVKKTPYDQLPQSEQQAIRSACFREWKRVNDQVEWRMEQASLYRRRQMVQVYKGLHEEMENVRQLLSDARSDPTVLKEDIERVDKRLNNGG